MTRYRVKVVLLSLGVVLGFGSAIARQHDWHHHAHHGPGGWGACWHDAPWSEGAAAPEGAATPKSSAPAQGTAPKTH